MVKMGYFIGKLKNHPGIGVIITTPMFRFSKFTSRFPYNP